MTGLVQSCLAALTPQAAADIALYGDHQVSVITWDRLVETCKQSSTYQLLHKTVSQGVPEDSQDWDNKIQPYFKLANPITTDIKRKTSSAQLRQVPLPVTTLLYILVS